MQAVVLLTAVALGTARPVPATEEGAAFVEIARLAGVDQVHDLTEICPPNLGSGSAWADVDSDGDVDLLVTNHGGPDRLYRNDGDVDGDGFLDFTDIAAEAGVQDTEGVGHGAVFVDYDRDGSQDLYVTRWQGNRLYLNDGSGKFSDQTHAAGLGDGGRAIGSAWADFDQDGWLDVYLVKNQECEGIGKSADVLYRNNGDSTFTDVSDWICSGSCPGLSGRGVTAGWLDYDDDGDPDLYVVNDSNGGVEQGNVLWRNDGADGIGGWTFSDVSLESGAGVALDGGGLGVGDADGDGWLDLAISNAGPNALLRNQGDGTFENVSAQSGIERATLPSGGPSVTWGVVFFDQNRDGFEDLLFVAGHDVDEPSFQPNAFFLNDGSGQFLDRSRDIGLDDGGRARNVSIADFDADGWVDLFVANYGEPPLLLENLQDEQGEGSHGLAVSVEGTASNFDGIGARVLLTTAAGRQIREISSGASHGGGHQRLAFFGLGAETEGELEVRWPSGIWQHYGTVFADGHFHVREGPSLEVAGLCPGDVTLHLSGLTPEGTAALLWSPEVGTSEVPRGPCSGVELGLAQPRLLATIDLDDQGVALLSRSLPEMSCGLHLQVLDTTSCEVSDVERLLSELSIDGPRTLLVGESGAMSAMRNGLPLDPGSLAWVSLTPAIVGVDSQGVATGLSQGIGLIQAAYGEFFDSYWINVSGCHVSEVVSGQLAGVECNKLPAPRGGKNDPMVVGALSAADDVRIVVRGSTVPNTSQLVGVRKVGEQVVRGAEPFDGTGTTVTFNTEDGCSLFSVVCGEDDNGNGSLESSEVDETFLQNLLTVTEGDSSASALNLRGFAFGLVGRAQEFLDVFLATGTAVTDATRSTETGFQSTVPTHPLGLEWDPQCKATIDVFSFARTSAFSLQVATTNTIAKQILVALDGHGGVVRDYFAAFPDEDEKTFDSFAWSGKAGGGRFFTSDWIVNDTSGFPTYSGVGLEIWGIFGNIGSISGEIETTYARGADGDFELDSITYSGAFEDLYDFDIHGGLFTVDGAKVQAGFPTLGAEGRILKIKLEFERTADGVEFPHVVPKDP